MKTLKSWALYILTQILIFGLLKAWKLDGNEHAGNLLLAMLWTLAAACIASAFMDAKFEQPPRSQLRRAVGTGNAIVLVLALAWYGHFVLAFFYVLGMLGSRVYRDKFDADGKPLPPAPELSVRSES